MSLLALQTGFARMVRRIPTTAARPGSADAATLRRISEERVDVYRDLVVGGHQAMLRYAVGTTARALALVQSERPKLASAESFREGVAAFVAESRGPRTHSLRELAAVYGRFLRRRFRKAFAAVPLLGALLRYELAELDVELSLDGPGRSADEEDLARLAAGTFDRLLRTRALVPSYARFGTYAVDIPRALRALRGANADLARLKDCEGAARTRVLLTRDPSDLLPRRIDLDAATFRALRAAKPPASFAIEVLAARRHGAGPRGESDEVAAGRVAGELFAWFRAGVLLLEARRPARARRKIE